MKLGMFMFWRGIYLLIWSPSALSVYRLPEVRGSLTCRDDGGDSVDWFIVYKPPSKKDTNNGSLMLYIDNKNADWRKLDSNILQKDNPLAVTLNSIYKDGDGNNVHVMYNDQPPKNATHNLGHTKGVINFDTESGYWLVHSVPGFPPPKSIGKYDFEKNGLRYGQTFLCLSIDYKYLDLLGQLLLYNHPQIYDFLLPEKFNESNPNLTSAIEGKHLDSSDLFSCNFSSIGGQKFIGFAKCSEYNEDLWVGIAKSLKTGLEVETWKHGRSENLPSSCKGDYKVENVKNLSILNFKFGATRDHAKWAVSKKQKIPGNFFKDAVVTMHRDSPSWICIGDINRQLSQKKRGGGAVCFKQQAVAGSFQESIRGLEECKSIHEYNGGFI